MSALNDLISQIQDESLRNRIQTEVDKLAKQKKFGLVFENHIPECTPLYDIPVKRGALVALKDGNIKENGQITEKEISDLLGLKKTRTFTVAKQMRDLGLIKVVGRGDSKKYLMK